MCQVSDTVWPGTTPRHRLGSSYFTNLIANGERGTPLANFRITPVLPLGPYFILKKKRKENKSKNRTKYTLYKDLWMQVLLPSWDAHVSVLVECPGPRIFPWGFFPSGLSFPQASEPREPGQVRSHGHDTQWTL